MTPMYHELQVAVKRLRDQILTDETALVQIRALLAKADRKRAVPGEARRKWEQVAENLETSLLETRARLEHNRVTLRHTEAQFAVLDSSLQTTSPQEEHVEPELAEDAVALARNTSLETLTRREAALLEAEAEGGDQVQERCRVELLNQLAGTVEGQAAATGEQRRQHLLREAIEKVQLGALDRISPDERRMLLICHSLLSRRLNPSAKDRHLLKVLGAALETIRGQGRQATVPPPLDI